jgi:hypothetical protein
MIMPFTEQQFLDVFASYNETVFPLQVVLLIAALFAIRLAGNDGGRSSKAVAFVLGVLWLWMGVVYHWIFFSRINGLAFLFGGLFVLQGVIFFYAGVVRRDLIFYRQPAGAGSVIGTLLIVYALLIYPIIGIAAGHSYPYSPTFGLPCPTTIFTFGLLARSGRSVPLYVLPIPFAWSLLGFSAAVSLGVSEDIGLFIAGVTATFLLVGSRTRQGYEVHTGVGLKEK